MKTQIEQHYGYRSVVDLKLFVFDYLHYADVVVFHPHVVVHGVGFDVDFVSVVDFRSCLFE